jgi:hypothetical protein
LVVLHRSEREVALRNAESAEAVFLLAFCSFW